jgi:hypothetical protein
MAADHPHASGRFEIEFIDPLFAVAIHLGLSEGLFHERWFARALPPQPDERFRIAVFALGLLTLVLAWMGYHRSIRRKPVRGFARFIIDILLVVLYAALLVKFDDLSSVLLIIVAIYCLYTLWDILKIVEYREHYAGSDHWYKRYGREATTIVWLLLFAFLWWSLRRQWVDPGAVLTAAFLATILHRVNKSVPIWRALGSSIAKISLHGTRS